MYRIASNGSSGERVVGLAREWDRDKILARDRGRRAGKRERSHEPEEEEEETRRPASTKSLEELFNKTRATPAVYWKPLSSVSTVAPDPDTFGRTRSRKCSFFKSSSFFSIMKCPIFQSRSSFSVMKCPFFKCSSSFSIMKCPFFKSSSSFNYEMPIP